MSLLALGVDAESGTADEMSMPRYMRIDAGSREIAARPCAEVVQNGWKEPSLTHMIPVACAGCT